MLSSIYDTDDIEYRDFIIEYACKHFSKFLFSEEELLLLKPTHHFVPRFKVDDVGFDNPVASKRGCCDEDKYDRELYERSGLNRACVREDFAEIEAIYQLNELDLSAWGVGGDRWLCLGWINLNFRSPRMRQAFLIQCVERVLREYGELIFSNECPDCGRLKRTPKATNCMWCL